VGGGGKEEGNIVSRGSETGPVGLRRPENQVELCIALLTRANCRCVKGLTEVWLESLKKARNNVWKILPFLMNTVFLQCVSSLLFYFTKVKFCLTST
jgi:hypothetical protein